jgi:hypothetical protein
MPLAFSFSAQRIAPVLEAALGMGSAYTKPHELVGLVEQPGAVKDPAFATLAFGAPGAAPRPAQLIDFQANQPPAAAPSPLPAPRPQMQAPPLNGQPYLTLGQAPTTHFHAPPPPFAVSTETELLVREVAGQVDQMRNDFFSAATNISALNDRLERLESRSGTSAGASSEVAALRADFETWISQHLEAAVEQCMRRVWARASMPPPLTSPAPTA